MCVIAIKHPKAELSFADISDMFIANPDGAGFAVVRTNKTLVFKGYQNAVDLFTALKKYWDKDLLVIHFRMATHGETKPELCHPFIVSSDINVSLKTCHETTRPVLFHNGIVEGFGNNVISDTLDFNLRILSQLNTVDDVHDVLSIVGSKFALVADGRVRLIGKFEKYKQIRVSNTYFTNDFIYAGWNDEPPIFAGKKLNCFKKPER